MRFLVIIIVSVFLSGFKVHKKNLLISIDTVFNNAPLIFNKPVYINKSGDTLSVETFRFYLSNFTCFIKGKPCPAANSCFLIDAEKEESKKLRLECPEPHRVDSISFIIGVDSLMNVSGALDGALDPALGMYWAWNTGYIFAKLEGKSPSCKTLHQAYEFHIGGFRVPFNAIKKINLKVKPGNDSIRLRADAARWFGGNDEISLKNFNSVVMPSLKALRVADNYSRMISVAE